MAIQHIIIILICSILLYYLIIRNTKLNEGFDDMCKLVYDYENYPQKEPAYSSIEDCLAKNTNILTEDNIIIYLINWPNGFGSALTVFIQNSYYLHNVNNKLHILPMFSNNSNNSLFLISASLNISAIPLTMFLSSCVAINFLSNSVATGG